MAVYRGRAVVCFRRMQATPNRSRPQTSIRVDVTVRNELADVANSIGYSLNELLQILACVDRGVILDMADKWAMAAHMSGREAARESSRRISMGLK